MAKKTKASKKSNSNHKGKRSGHSAAAVVHTERMNVNVDPNAGLVKWVNADPAARKKVKEQLKKHIAEISEAIKERTRIFEDHKNDPITRSVVPVNKPAKEKKSK